MADDSTSSAQNFTQLSGRADFLCPFSLGRDAISQWIRQRNSIKSYASFGESETGTLAIIRQEFGEESVTCTRKVRTYQTEKSDTGEGQSQEHAHNFLCHRPDRPNNSIPHNTVTFYGDCVKKCEDFAPKFGDKKTGSCIATMRVSNFLFYRRIFY
jgi:hypothetical protein